MLLSDLNRELASAYDRVGDIRGGIRNPSLGDTAGALESYGTALEIREGLRADFPDDLELQKEISISHLKIGDMLGSTGDLGGALAAYSEMVKVTESLAGVDPQYRRTHAIGLNNVGKTLFALGKLGEARRAYDRSLDIRRELALEEPEAS